MKNQPKVDTGKFPKTIALIGTSCAGKTTMAHGLVSRLKSYGVLASGLFDQDRKFSFPIERIASEEAQSWMITNIIAKECDIGLHPDVDVLVMDRSPLCLLAYYSVQYPLSSLYVRFEALVMEWMRRYAMIVYLPPLPFQDDGKRPDDEFRIRVDTELNRLIQKLENRDVTVIRPERHKVLEEVLIKLKVQKPGVKNALSDEDLQGFADAYKIPILLKPQRSDADVFTDQDLWFLLKPEKLIESGYTASQFAAAAKDLIRLQVGPYVPFDVNVGILSMVDQLPSGRIFLPKYEKLITLVPD